MPLNPGYYTFVAGAFGQVEFTQPLGVGLGLAVRINNQYSHPVCTGRCTDNFTTINDTREISRLYQLLIRERGCRDSGIRGNGNHVNDRQMRWTDESQMMMSCRSCTSQSHKRSRTNEVIQNLLMSRPGME